MEFLTLKEFLWVQAVLFAAGVFYLLNRARGPRAGMRWGRRPRGLVAAHSVSQGESQGRPIRRPRQEGQGEAPSGIRDLSVHFNYNGHTWEAHEVLGIPAGCSVDAAQEACIKVAEGADEVSRGFYEAALFAIQSRR